MSEENLSGTSSYVNDETIVTSTIFKLSIPGEYSEKYHYSRYGNPTRDVLESSLASGESSKYALTFSSKTAASLAVLSSFKADDLIIFSDVRTCEKLNELVALLQLETLDFGDVKTFEKSLKPTTKVVWIESTMNPFISVIDIKAIADIAHEKSKAIVVVDNTLMTSQLQRPLELDADIVLYSLNEYVSGHDDVNMGAAITNDLELYERLRYYQVFTGVVPSPFDCYLVNRSLKTLSLRMEKHSENGFAVAQFLETHPKIQKVFHPSLKSHKNHVIALKQSYGHSGILSFYINGSFEQSKTFFKSLKLILKSQSLGGVQSTVMYPWTTMEKEKFAASVTAKFVILSVGVEKLDDILKDLNQALSQI